MASRAKSRGGIRSSDRSSEEWGYVIIWEFQLRAGMEKRFEKVYGSDGDWARLFARDATYIGTELIHHFNGGRIYVTLDFWTSQEAFDDFKRSNLVKYKALDRKCEALTESEREIGSFVRVLNK
jgi:hypothetical protein